MTILRFLGSFLFIGMLICCAKTQSVAPRISSETKTHAVFLYRKLHTIFPDKCRFSARVTVSFNNREMDFLTYTAMNGADIRSRAMTEFGGTLFDFLIIDGRIMLLTFPRQFSEKIVRRGPAGDLYHLFYVPRMMAPVEACGDSCISISSSRNTRHDFEFSPEDVLARSLEYGSGNLLREIEYSNWKTAPNVGIFPGRIVVIHRALGYRCIIDILEVKPGLPNTNIFKLPEDTQ